MNRLTRRPTRIASFLSIVAAFAAVGLVASKPPQLLALGIDVAGVTLIGVAALVAHRGHRIVGSLIGLVALGVVLVSAAAGGVLPATTTDKVEAPLGLLGIGVVAFGLAPVRMRSARRFVTAGTVLLLLSIGLVGLVHGADMLMLLGAFTAAIVAWDVGEQAINVGQQLGTGVRTWPIELSHAGASTAFGAVAIGVAVGFHSVNVTGIPLTALLALVTASIVLLIALYN